MEKIWTFPVQSIQIQGHQKVPRDALAMKGVLKMHLPVSRLHSLRSWPYDNITLLWFDSVTHSRYNSDCVVILLLEWLLDGTAGPSAGRVQSEPFYPPGKNGNLHSQYEKWDKRYQKKKHWNTISMQSIPSVSLLDCSQEISGENLKENSTPRFIPELFH